MPPPPPRIALLLCDTPPPPVRAAWGDYTAIFTRLLSSSALAVPGYIVDPFDVVQAQEYPPSLDGYDLLLLTGSAASAYADEAWIGKLVEYMRVVLTTTTETKVVGICFGHQIVGRALGVRVGVNPRGWEVGPTRMGLTDAGRALFNESEEELCLQQMHRDYVEGVPDGYRVLAETDVCATQGFVSEDGRVVTLQGHPEFTQDIVGMLVGIRGEAGVLDKSVVEDVGRRMGDATDGRKVADLVWRMI